MITKSYIKTIVSGLLARIRTHEISEDELLNHLSEMDVVQPLANNDGSMYVNNSGEIYIL